MNSYLGYESSQKIKINLKVSENFKLPCGLVEQMNISGKRCIAFIDNAHGKF
jgi:hypothetical protein